MLVSNKRPDDIPKDLRAVEKTVTNNKMSSAPNECEKIEFEGKRNAFILYGETLENSNMTQMKQSFAPMAMEEMHVKKKI